MRYLYMKVTSDIYELPLAVADSTEELAQMVGARRNTIDSIICHAKDGKRKRSKYCKVEWIDDDTEADSEQVRTETIRQA